MKSFVQLTDTHIRAKGQLAYRRVDTAALMQQAVQAIESLPLKPDAVVLTGDLTDFGRMPEYEHLAELLAPLSMPYYLMPGNHDDADVMRQCFAGHDYLGEPGQPVQYVLDLEDMVVVAIDTSVYGQSAGALCETRLRWLDETLAEQAGRPTIIAMHHPPFLTYIESMDEIGLMSGREAFVEIVARYPQVERIICGHVHRSIEARIAHTVASCAPSSAHQVDLNLSSGVPERWVMEPPGLKIHVWGKGGPLVTHLAYTGDFDGPYPFHENGKLID